MWNTLLIEPLFNTLIWLVTFLPGSSLGLAVVVLTLIIRIILFPLSRKTIKNQLAQTKLQPYVQQIKQKIKDNKEQATQIMELYKLNKSNPFSGCLTLLVQLPILLALYTVLSRGVDASVELLYSGIEIPADFTTMFLGVDLAETSIIMALLTGLAQFAQLSLLPTLRNQKKTPTVVPEGASDKEKVQIQATNIMQKSIRFVLPVMITFFAWRLPAAVALYWMVSTLFVVVQEVVVRLSHAEVDVVLPESLANHEDDRGES